MQTQVVNVNRFSGINNSDAPGRIPDPELIRCQNFNLGQYGELIKRLGIKTLGTVEAGQPVVVIGYFQTVVYSQLIIRAGNNLYYSSDGVTFSLIGNYGNVEYGVQYVNKFYMVRRDNIMVQWDGVAASTIAGSPFGTICIVHKDLLFVANSFSANESSTVYYSDAGTPGDFTLWTGQSFKVRPGDGDVVTALALIHDILVIFKQESTWMLYVTADIVGWELRNVNPEIGCISKYSPKDVEGMLYFTGPRGFYRTDGYNFAELSLPVRNLFRNQPTGIASINQLTSAWWEDKIIMIIQTYTAPPTWNSVSNRFWDDLSATPWDSQNATYTWLVYHLRTQQWTEWLPAAAANIKAFNMIEVLGPITMKGLYIGSRGLDGKLYRHGDPVYTDGTDSQYETIVETKDLDFEAPAYVRRGLWVTVERQGAGDVQVYNIPDNNQQPASVLHFGDPGHRTALRVPGPGFFRTWRIRTQSSQAGPLTLYGFSIAITPREQTLRGA